jgi:hypothetical protein
LTLTVSSQTWQGQQRLIGKLDQNSTSYGLELEDATEMAEGMANDMSDCFDFDEEQIELSARRLAKASPMRP